MTRRRRLPGGFLAASWQLPGGHKGPPVGLEGRVTIEYKVPFANPIFIGDTKYAFAADIWV